MNKSLVSILIPCYNVEEYLSHCLNSIINQTYSNLQIVLINDGSKDNTWEIMQDYAAKDSRIEIYNQQNQGVAITRNHLLEKVKGDYVLFIDSDDWCEFDMVEYLVYNIIKNCADVSICSNVINNITPVKEYKEQIWDKTNTIKNFLFHKELRGSLCNKLVKTSLLQNLEFKNEISYGEDALFCWHFFQKVDVVFISTKQLYHYRMNDSSICHSSFSSKKFSGHYVWEQICKETAELYPDFLHIAQARHCIEDLLLLRDAAHCNYKNKNDIIILQKTIRNLRHNLRKTNITSIKMKLFAMIVPYSYWITSKI